MSIVDAIGKACGLHGCSAARPTGLVVLVTRQGGLRRPTASGSVVFAPGLQDVVADDWLVLDAETTAAAIAELAKDKQASA